METNTSNPDKSSTGLAPNLAGALAYLLGPLTGILFLVIEKESRFVRFHAMQSTIVFGALFVLQVVLQILPILGSLLVVLVVFPLSVLLWAFLMFKAFSGEMFKLPTIGDIAERNI
jgi:uncharacterized membrane protein